MVLYNGMASTSPWAALYFVALMTFGNYVLFNLLVAILVEGFQAEVRAVALLIRIKVLKHGFFSNLLKCNANFHTGKFPWSEKAEKNEHFYVVRIASAIAQCLRTLSLVQLFDSFFLWQEFLFKLRQMCFR